MHEVSERVGQSAPVVARSTNLCMCVATAAVYGGQVVGQAVAASARCVTDKKALHSLHSYFLKGGNPEVPILYHVQRLSVSNNFENHNIIAKQQGQVIFSCTASYHRPEESTLFHERPMPTAPVPETLMNQEDRLQEVLLDPRLPERKKQGIMKALETPFPIDCRVVDPDCFFNPSKQIPRKLVWMKARIPLSDAEPNMHRCVAAFNSDWGLCSTSLLPHGISIGSPDLKVSIRFIIDIILLVINMIHTIRLLHHWIMQCGSMPAFELTSGCCLTCIGK